MAIGNLPSELSAFVGRDGELGHLLELQARARVLTVVGPPGVGKSRLAWRLGAAVRSNYSDGAWLVDVADGSSVSDVTQAIASTVGSIGGRRLLLILDNCEHLVADIADLTTQLVRECPELRVVATSRETLRIEGEVVWRVAPLSTPPAGLRSPHELETFDAVRLFVDRMSVAQPGFMLTDANAHAVSKICRRMDGLPLAIELAVARAATLGLEEAATRRSRLAVLVNGPRSAPSRHQTLRAALDWSYQLLTDLEQSLLARLSVFGGGWNVEAAEAVCGGNGLSREQVVDGLAQLVAKSLVEVEAASQRVRYRLLATVRDYAHERLLASGEASEYQQHLAMYMLSLAERVPPESLDAAQAAVLDQERGNLREALRWTLEHAEADLGLRLASAAFPLWYFRGHSADGVGWLDQLLALPSAVNSAARGEALGWAGQLLLMQGRYGEAESRLQSALDARARHADGRGMAIGFTALANVVMWRGDLVRARDLYAEAAVRLHAQGSRAETFPVFQSGLIACEFEEFERAAALADELEALGQSWRHELALGAAIFLRGQIAARRGEFALGRRLLEEALDVQRLESDRIRIIDTQTELGHVLVELHQTADARAASREAVDLAATAGELVRVVRAMEGIARAVATSQPASAVRLFGAAEGMRTAAGCRTWPSDRRRSSAWLARVRRRLGATVFASEQAAGAAMTADRAISFALELATRDGTGAADARPLTPRERELAVLIAHGLSNRQIANRLGISVATVRVHVDHIFAKLELHSRAQVAVWASQHGMLADSRGA